MQSNKEQLEQKGFVILKNFFDKEYIQTLRQKAVALDSFCGHPITTQYQFTTKVKVDTLDNLIAEHNLPTPDHIKIDIDGSEYAFLLGANKSLLLAKSIIIELYEYNEYFQKIIDILEKEYKFKLIKQSTELEPGLRDYWFIK